MPLLMQRWQSKYHNQSKDRNLQFKQDAYARGSIL